MNKDQIVLTAEQATAIAKSILDVLQQFSPSVAAVGGPIGLGITAAQALIPLINQIPLGRVISVEEQAQLMADIEEIANQKAFSGPEWKESQD